MGWSDRPELPDEAAPRGEEPRPEARRGLNPRLLVILIVVDAVILIGVLAVLMMR